MQNKLLFRFILLVLVLCTMAACSKAPSDARKALTKKNIFYTESSFIDSARKGDINTVKLFLDAGMNPDVKDAEGNTALIYAAQKGNAKLVKLLLSKYANVNIRNNNGISAILTAKLQGNEKVEAMLRKAGAQEFKPELDKVLLDAVSKGNIDKVKELLAQGADPKAKNTDGKNTLQIAEENGYNELAFLLKRSDAALTPDSNMDAALLQASFSGDIERVKNLLAHGANINARDTDGRTALIAAAYRGHTKVVNLLLAYYVDINIKDNDGLTALMLAAGFGHTDVVRALIAKGTALDVKVETGRYAGLTALKFAAHEGYAEIVKLLKEAGAKE